MEIKLLHTQKHYSIDYDNNVYLVKEIIDENDKHYFSITDYHGYPLDNIGLKNKLLTEFKIKLATREK